MVSKYSKPALYSGHGIPNARTLDIASAQTQLPQHRRAATTTVFCSKLIWIWGKPHSVRRNTRSIAQTAETSHPFQSTSRIDLIWFRALSERPKVPGRVVEQQPFFNLFIGKTTIVLLLRPEGRSILRF